MDRFRRAGCLGTSLVSAADRCASARRRAPGGRACRGSGFAARRAGSQECARQAPLCAPRRARTLRPLRPRPINAKVKTKSSAVTGAPSLQRASLRSVNRYERPSSETVKRSARSGSISKSRPIATSPRKRLIATQFAKSLLVRPGAVSSTGHAAEVAQLIRSLGSSRRGAGTGRLNASPKALARQRGSRRRGGG